MAGGGKGGSQTSTVTIPPWLEAAAQKNLARADDVSAIGYTPYYGPDVAAFSPAQNAAFDNTNQAAGAFGMPTAQGNGMPAPQQFAGGVSGHSSGGLYDQSVAEFARRNPGQAAAMANLFIDPTTGGTSQFTNQYGVNPAGQPAAVRQPNEDPNMGLGPGQNYNGGFGLSVNEGTLGGNAFDAAFGDPFGGVKDKSGGGGMGGGK